MEKQLESMTKTPEEEKTELEIVSEIFRYNLKLLRQSKNMSGQELSEKFCMEKNRINDIENGKHTIKFCDVVQIVDYFDVTFNDVLEGKIDLCIKSRHKNCN